MFCLLFYVLALVFFDAIQINVYARHRHHVHLRLGYDHRHRGSLICLHLGSGSMNFLILIGWNDWIDLVDCSSKQSAHSCSRPWNLYYLSWNDFDSCLVVYLVLIPH